MWTRDVRQQCKTAILDEEPGKSVQSREKLPAHLVELYHRSKSCIGQEHEVQLIELLTDFQDVFSSGPSDFGTTNVTTHKVDVGDATPINNRQEECR